jgi:hypothetical protein
MSELGARLRALQERGALNLPLPGAGHTCERHRALVGFGRDDLSAARLVEAHTDALAILAEAARGSSGAALYGVWASDGPQSRLIATALPDGSWQLDGAKQYCSGARIVSDALVTAHGAEGILLFEVPLNCPGITVLPTTWVTPALADTVTAPVSFDRVRLPAAALVGDTNWYLDRPGFWHGAIGPAACWAGGALSLVDAAVATQRPDPHSRAHFGALEAVAWGLDAVLCESGQQIDRDPTDERHEARKRALKVRHLIERWCTEVMDRMGRATGPQLLAFDDRVVRQYGALTVYVRQSHAERDLAAIAGAPALERERIVNTSDCES